VIQITVPSGRDVYIEIDGEKAAAVQGYKIISERKTKNISEVFSGEPAGVILGQTSYKIELTRMLLKNNINFYKINNFNLVIIKENKKIIYSGCEWEKISENTEAGKNIFENIIITSSKREEV
jgi:hypothetical protein